MTRLLTFGHRGRHRDCLVHADNLAVLGALPDGTLDAVYLDPPFGTGTVRRGGESRPGSQYRDELHDPDAFVNWLDPRLAELRRALAAHGSLFVHLDYRTVHYVKVALDRLFGRDRFINEIVWCYSVGGKSRRSFGRKHDTILWYGRSADYAFYPQAVRAARKPNSHMRVVRTETGELVQEKTDRRTGKVYRYPVDAGKIPEDWWTDIETLNRSAAERTGWPTQKPERLLARIIAATTRPGDRVADPFCGSGTTAVVAQRTGRRFLAIDASADAVRCTAERLERAGAALAEAGQPPPDVAVYSGTPHSLSVELGASPEPGAASSPSTVVSSPS